MLANNLMETSLDRGEMHEKFTVAYDQLIKCAFFFQMDFQNDF